VLHFTINEVSNAALHKAIKLNISRILIPNQKITLNLETGNGKPIDRITVTGNNGRRHKVAYHRAWTWFSPRCQRIR